MIHSSGSFHYVISCYAYSITLVFLNSSTTFTTSDALTGVIIVLMSSAKETKDRFKIQIEQLLLNS